MVKYFHPKKVDVSWLQGRPLLSLPEGGQVVVDRAILALWQAAEDFDLDVLLRQDLPGVPADMDQRRAALACLSEAGLLERLGDVPLPVSSSQVKSSTTPLHTIAKGVSAIIVNYNSQDWLAECLDSLQAQTCPPGEIIVVDNASPDDPSNWLRGNYPAVRILRLDPIPGESRSLASAINRGTSLAQGSFFLLLNPDLTLQVDAVEQMLQAAERNPDSAAIAPKLRFWWAPAFLNGLGNHAGAFDWGTDNGLGHLDLGQFDTWTEVPSACFAATLIKRDAWQSSGPLDEGFPMYYEDIEWCYRARQMGMKVLAAPQSVVYHALGQRVHTGADTLLGPVKLRSVTYGRLRYAARLLGTSAWLRHLAGYALADLGLTLTRMLRWDLRSVGAVFSGWGMFIKERSHLRRQYAEMQTHRQITDRQLFSLQRQIPPPLIWRGLPEMAWDTIVTTYLPLIQSRRSRLMPEFSTTRPRLLIISHDIVAEKMAGPGMRYLEMGRALSAELEVTLAVPGVADLPFPGLHLEAYQFEKPGSLQRLAGEADVILLSSFILEKFPFLKNLPVRRVVDLYDPLVLENLHLYQTQPMDMQTSLNSQAVAMMNRLVAVGDYFICGNERQRDFWMGVLAANGRVNPLTFTQHPGLRGLIDVVGVGFPDRPPQPRPLLRGVHPGFPPGAKIVLWGGGIWDWLDPLTLVKAWPALLAKHPHARLVFLGTRHPNPMVPRHQMAEQVDALAQTIGEKDRTIFFYEWLSYSDREALLCEADVGVVLHQLHLETRYSIRTRVMDYLWAGLPVLVTEGDVTSQWVAEGGLGQVVPPLDQQAVAQALDDLLSQPKTNWASAFDPLKDTFAWSRVVDPLRQYCLNGVPAPDQAVSHVAPSTSRGQSGFSSSLARARFILRKEGLGVLLHHLRRYMQWRLTRY